MKKLALSCSVRDAACSDSAGAHNGALSLYTDPNGRSTVCTCDYRHRSRPTRIQLYYVRDNGPDLGMRRRVQARIFRSRRAFSPAPRWTALIVTCSHRATLITGISLAVERRVWDVSQCCTSGSEGLRVLRRFRHRRRHSPRGSSNIRDTSRRQSVSRDCDPQQNH